MRRRVYTLVRRFLSQANRQRLLRMDSWFANRAASFRQLRSGRFDAAALQSHLQEVLQDFEVLMVHSSFDRLRLGYSGTIAELLQILVDLVAHRTLAMPTFFFAGGRSLADYYSSHAFDVRRNPSEMGLLSEVFRRRSGVRRSYHPTHSVCALGPLSDLITSSHHLAGTTFGEATPFGVMAERKTAILGLGVEYFRCLTQVHACEDLLQDYPVQVVDRTIPTVIIDDSGRRLSFQLPLRKPLHRDLGVLESLLDEKSLKEWRFGGVPFFLADASAVTGSLMDSARQGTTIYTSR